MRRLGEITNFLEFAEPDYTRRPSRIGPLASRNLSAVRKAVEQTPFATGALEIIDRLEKLDEKLPPDSLDFISALLDQITAMATIPVTNWKSITPTFNLQAILMLANVKQFLYHLTN
jgi:hypothetical protein